MTTREASYNSEEARASANERRHQIKLIRLKAIRRLAERSKEPALVDLINMLIEEHVGV